ncbi:MAG TPA: hypothetical protein DD725_01805 [Deltaproteobacteria bacterium]|nr:hypothetical protein [Deltaproteobacteria bacterium]
MNLKDLCEEIAIEVELLESVIKEISLLRNDLTEREPTVREKTAAGAFLAQFYGGIENIMKRISLFHSVPMPTGDNWHADLFRRFCQPPYKTLPLLFDEQLAIDMAPFRKFRHVVYHGYGFELDWDRMKEGLAKNDDVFNRFKHKLNEYLNGLEK